MLKKLKLLDKLTIIISVTAITISIVSTYFQFFNKRHKVLYSSLEPSFNNVNQTISIPVLFKNLGNQTEVILDSDLKLETKKSDGSFYRNLPLQGQTSFPLLLSPNESKLIKLTGSYKEYLFGSFEISEKNEFIYHPITILDSLKLLVDMRYITTSGVVGNQELTVGYMSFNENKKFERIDCNAIKIRKLPIRRSDFKIIYFSKLSQESNVTLELDPNDTNLVDKLNLINKMLADSSLTIK